MNRDRKGHKAAVEATITSKQDGDVITYTAVAVYEGKQYTDVKKVEVKKEEKDVPKTGDAFPIAIILSLMAMAVIGGVIVTVKHKK